MYIFKKNMLCLYIKYIYTYVNIFKKYTVCVCIYIYIINIHSIYTHILCIKNILDAINRD